MTHQKTLTKNIRVALVLGAVLSAATFSHQVFAESLFRASATYQANAPFTPHSLITQPRVQNVGDIVTVLINEETQLESDTELKITKNQVMNNQGTMFNQTIGFLVNKLPFISDQRAASINNRLAAPNYSNNGLPITTLNNIGSKAESSRTNSLTDRITCQVVQVMPNGYLVVQGHKVIDVNKDRQDTYVTGIVNPYYLNRNNEIASRQVGNFQLMQGGKGVLTRQQNDGIANKIQQFFN